MKNKTCTVKECIRKYKAKNYCNMHYLRWIRNGSAGEMSERKLPNGTLRILGEPYKKEYFRFYRQLRGYKSLPYMNKIRFGNVREAVILRDDECCVNCGMTREDHKEKFGRDITVNHKDHCSKRSNNDSFFGKPNNELSNLETLCLHCHGSVDGRYSVKLRKAG